MRAHGRSRPNPGDEMVCGALAAASPGFGEGLLSVDQFGSPPRMAPANRDPMRHGLRCGSDRLAAHRRDCGRPSRTRCAAPGLRWARPGHPDALQSASPKSRNSPANPGGRRRSEPVCTARSKGRPEGPASSPRRLARAALRPNGGGASGCLADRVQPARRRSLSQPSMPSCMRRVGERKRRPFGRRSAAFRPEP